MVRRVQAHMLFLIQLSNVEHVGMVSSATHLSLRLLLQEVFYSVTKLSLLYDLFSITKPC
jgi:hypothetical protein